MGFVADILGFGNAAGPHFDFDYSTATGAGITNLTQAQLASSSGVASIIYASADGQSVVLRSDVDVDPIATDGYPRSEWREKASNGTTDRAFTDTTGDHMVEVLVLPMHLPPVNPAFVLLQEHDSAQDLLEIVVKARSDYATSGRLEVALKVAIGGSSTSNGVPRFIADFGTLAELISKPKWLNAKIRTGLIHAGAAGWSATVNGVTINSWDAGVPTRDASVSNTCYYKSGMYLQTKWTGSGSAGHEGVETDRNEYGEAAWRSIKVTHNGESLPFIPVTGARVDDTISNVRWGAKAEGVNTAGTSFTLTPALPASLVKDDMIYVIARTRRTAGSSAVSSPAIESVSPQWSRYNANNASTEFTTNTGAPSDLLSHSQRLRIWCRPWFSGMADPVLTYTSGTGGANPDIMSAQCLAIYGGKLGAAAEVVDQVPDNFNFGASSTTVLGPTAALPANADSGALALVLLANEFNVPSGSATTVSGDGLTWVEGGEGIGTTTSFQAWANDHAIVPATAGQAITAKSSANTARTTGKSASVLMTLKKAKKRRHHNRVPTSTG